MDEQNAETVGIENEALSDEELKSLRSRPSMDSLVKKADEYFEKSDRLKSLADAIDDRSLFVDGTALLLRLLALFGVFFGALIILVSVFKALDAEYVGSAAKTVAVLINLTYIVPLSISGLLIFKRASQIAEDGISTVIELFLISTRISVEVIAVFALSVAFLGGIATVLLGGDGPLALSHGLNSMIMAMGEFEPSSGGDGSAIRLMGLLFTIGSTAIGFGVLLYGYVIHDLAQLIYRFFNRK
jgi:hypothetical protein